MCRLGFLKTLLTNMIREERFTAGALANYASVGYIAGVLRRMKELSDAGDFERGIYAKY